MSEALLALASVALAVDLAVIAVLVRERYRASRGRHVVEGWDDHRRTPVETPSGKFAAQHSSQQRAASREETGKKEPGK